MHPKSNEFTALAKEGLQNERLQTNLGLMRQFSSNAHAFVTGSLGDYQSYRDHGIKVRQHALDHLDVYLEQFEESVTNNGGQVHWAEGPDDLNKAVIDIIKAAGAKRIIKGKSMISEETALNVALEGAGYRVRETDLGEYIIQLAEEPPSHIVGPAIHKTPGEVEELFHKHHDLGERDISSISAMVAEGRDMLRDDFINADVGIIGANLIIAESGQTVLVTNEGNGDLSSTLPRTHIVVTSIDKVVARQEDAMAVLRLLARNATGQPLTAYTSFYSGPKREGDLDGPEEFHVILLDNGRSEILGGKYKDMLRCIRCAACLNQCPVYSSVGGHAYGWIYSGPMGSVLAPLLIGLENTKPLPDACTSCGKCAEVCPMGIPLPDYLRELRREKWQEGLTPAAEKIPLSFYMRLGKHPRLYHLTMGVGRWALRQKWLHPVLTRLPLLKGWVHGRDLPNPASRESFIGQWRKHQQGGDYHD